MPPTLKLAILRGPQKGIIVPFTQADEALALAYTLFMELHKNMSEHRQTAVQPRHFVKNFWQAYASASAEAEAEATQANSQHILCQADGFHFILLINQEIPTVRNFHNDHIIMTEKEARLWYRITLIPIVSLGDGLFKLTEEASAAAAAVT